MIVVVAEGIVDDSEGGGGKELTGCRRAWQGNGQYGREDLRNRFVPGP